MAHFTCLTYCSLADLCINIHAVDLLKSKKDVRDMHEFCPSS